MPFAAPLSQTSGASMIPLPQLAGGGGAPAFQVTVTLPVIIGGDEGPGADVAVKLMTPLPLAPAVAGFTVTVIGWEAPLAPPFVTAPDAVLIESHGAAEGATVAFQVRVDPGAPEFTTFTTPLGLAVTSGRVAGLKLKPATGSQRMMKFAVRFAAEIVCTLGFDAGNENASAMEPKTP